MRVLVCGGRDYADREHVYQTLARLYLQRRISVVIHGGARGADKLAEDWATMNGICSMRFPAHWERRGRAAGPIRNGHMLEHGRPEGVVAFPGGPGTAGMLRLARAAGIEVLEIPAR